MSQQTTTQWQAFLDTAKAKYATACDVYQTALNDADATMESLTTAQDAYNAAGAQWATDQHTANQMAAVEPATQDFATMTTAELREYAETVQAEYDADELTGPMGRQIVRDAWARVEAAEAAKATTPTAAEVIATINENEAFGVAWGADGQVLTHAETCEAIASGRGWFDRQGRWVNRAGWERKIDAMITSK